MLPNARATADQALQGAAVGTAVGDALGLPREGLTADRARRIYGEPIRPQFLGSRGVVSDDTEHTVFTLQALRFASALSSLSLRMPKALGDRRMPGCSRPLGHALRHAAGDRTPSENPHLPAAAFGRHLARSLRWWLISGPPGIGLGTLRALIRSWLGWRPHTSGVRSAGNGPAMRSGVIGVFHHRNPEARRAFVRASTRITHTDPRAEVAAYAVAEAAALACSGPVDAHEALNVLGACSDDAEWTQALTAMRQAFTRGDDVATYATAIAPERGGRPGFVTGYAYHAVPVALYAWLRHPRDYVAAVTSVIAAGGDTDSTAAITGGLVGAAVGVDGIPVAWRQSIADWPMSLAWIQQVASLRDGRPPSNARLAALPLRNLLVFGVIVAHIGRRWLP